ncbi:MAG: (d)CMP kinase, partial [Veillonella sp.]|nr:(d)CMP kinase [Veillonella sp.]
SISKIVAKKLGYLYIDTGAMYRSVTWAVLHNHIDVNNQKAVEALLPELDLTMEASDDSCKVFIAGQDVTDFIRTPQVNNAVSIVASYKGVRQYLVERQRLMAEAGGVILDGRDIGSVVLPNAELKIYLTASVEARAMRRYLEVKGTVNEQPLEDIKDSVMQRDDMDKNRKESPLIQVEDAVLVDSSEMTFDETVEHILHLVQERI